MWSNFLLAISVLAFTLAITALVCQIAFPRPKIEKITNKKVIHAGELVINRSDPNKDVMRFELAVPIGDLENYEEVIFKVVNAS